MNEAVRVVALAKCYHGKNVLNNLNLSVKPGMVFGLLGANGAGNQSL